MIKSEDFMYKKNVRVLNIHRDNMKIFNFMKRQKLHEK